MISQLHLIRLPFQSGPQRATSTTMGTYSLGVICITAQYYVHANHIPSHTAPQPEASDVIVLRAE